jgi:predicted RNA-binding protein with RPS1 domain
VQQKVRVAVTGVDIERNRISLSMKKDPFTTKANVKSPSKKPGNEKDSLEDKLSMLKNKFRK